MRRQIQFLVKAKETGIDALIMEVHGGNPVGMLDTTDFTDYAAIAATKKAAALAKKYGIELHIWMWIINRCEKICRRPTEIGIK